ncbi:glycosyltransferase family 4 protein [Bacteroides caecimuris]|uniref:glycosyltransferase family 4 protein n=1 Tax=Bacteroides caecimuris TaxID=1796613 RepID=UPI00272C04CB|nr:glycosyltransferase family 4 protein [Bacteroides caecimuris]
MRKKLFIVVNQDWFFLSHRLPVGIAARNSGYDVTVISEDTGVSYKIRDAGLKTVNLPINKAGTNVRDEIRTLSFLYRLFRNEKPDIVHLVGLKTMLWGSIACRLAGIKAMVSAVCGLGVLFDEKHAGSLMSRSILKVLRLTHCRKGTMVIFQNNDDKSLFLSSKIIKEEQCAFTNGSGIDLKNYDCTPEPFAGLIKVIFTARMVEDKGTLVLIDAAKKLEAEYKGKVRFLLCGGLDTNPNGITEDMLKSKCDGEYIQWLGHRTDVLELLKQSHIMAFPSWYREGLPKSVIEAEAIGRPVVTTDSVGCRDTVIDGYNGFMIPAKDSDALASALKKLIDAPELRQTMGRNAREFAVDKFDIKDVITVHLQVYNEVSKFIRPNYRVTLK